MTETVYNVTDLPAKTSFVKKFAKRTAVAAIAAVVVTAIYLKTQDSGSETDTETTEA